MIDNKKIMKAIKECEHSLEQIKLCLYNPKHIQQPNEKTILFYQKKAITSLKNIKTNQP